MFSVAYVPPPLRKIKLMIQAYVYGVILVSVNIILQYFIYVVEKLGWIKRWVLIGLINDPVLFARLQNCVYNNRKLLFLV